MNFIYQKTLFLFTFLLYYPLNGNSQTVTDSIINIQTVERLLETDPDNALLMLEKVKEQKQTPQYKIDWVATRIYMRQKRFRMAINYGQQTLESDSVRNNWSLYCSMCDNLVNAYKAVGNYEEALRYASRMQELMEQNNVPEQRRYMAIDMTAKIQRMMGNKEKAYNLSQQALQAVEKCIEEERQKSTPSPYPYLYFTLYNGIRTSWFIEDNRNEEALHTSLRSYPILMELKKLKGGDLPKRVPDQVYKNTASQVFLMLANTHLLNGKKEEEKKWYNEYLSNSPSPNMDLYGHLIDYLANKKEYRQVIFLTNEFVQKMDPADSVTVNHMTAAYYLSNAHEHLKEYPQALAHQKRVVMLKDSLEARKQRSNALEMATIYETIDKERQIERQENQLQRSHILLASSGGILILMGTVLYLIVHNWHITNRKNRAMAKQLQEQFKYNKNSTLELPSQNKVVNAIEAPSANEQEDSPDNISKAGMLFHKLQELIVEKEMYKNPRLTRDIVISELGTNKNFLSATIHKYTGATFTDYVNKYRLSYALERLTNSNDTIDVIAENAGFGSDRTFYRIFRNKYEMSPTEYKKIIIEQNSSSSTLHISH